jgi:hypothetical protein
VGRRFRFTHPFHPLRGRDFERVDHRSSWGDDWLYFYDDEGRLRSVRAGWTDAGGADPFVEVSAGRSLFRVVDLLRLVELVEEMSS